LEQLMVMSLAQQHVAVGREVAGSEFQSAFEATEALFVNNELSEIETIVAVNRLLTNGAIFLARFGFDSHVLVFHLDGQGGEFSPSFASFS